MNGRQQWVGPDRGYRSRKEVAKREGTYWAQKRAIETARECLGRTLTVDPHSYTAAIERYAEYVAHETRSL